MSWHTMKVACYAVRRTVPPSAEIQASIEKLFPKGMVDHFDIARDLKDADALIATEVSKDRTAMEREEALPEETKVVELMQSGVGGGVRVDRPRRCVIRVACNVTPRLLIRHRARTTVRGGAQAVGRCAWPGRTRPVS
jgi:hypothetical protein